MLKLTSGNEDSLLIAAAWNSQLGNRSDYYLEAGITTGDSDGSVAGGGIPWMPRHNVQFDAYALAGIGGDAPDVQAGFGLSVYFD